jgi:(p)ppGpp synthase/HD superfamily hydrolase
LNQNPWDSLERAIELAVKAHFGQRDKSGLPYILHLVRVMEGVSDPTEKQAAILHDYIEDAGGTVETLENHKISKEAIRAIVLLTRPEGDSYCEYVIQLSHHPIARIVKLADLNDNYRIGRVAYRDEHTAEDSRRMQKYALTHQFLTRAIDEPEYRRRMADLE